MACILGNAVGDALGAHTEFQSFNPTKKLIQSETWHGISNFTIYKSSKRTSLGLTTDDFSMARCIVDSILSNNFQFNLIDLRIRFVLWWYKGYCNGSKNQRSFGLGGNIAIGFQQFINNFTEYTITDVNNKNIYSQGNISGNGSIMRLSPIPVAYRDNINQGMEIARLQSLTTHNGFEAAELCRLLTFIAIKLINYEGNNPKEVLENIHLEFQSESLGVNCMSKSQGEDVKNLDFYDRHHNISIEDRYWDWRSKDFRPSPTRKAQQPSYFGSYAMDGAYTALYIIYHSNSLTQAIFQAVNWGGDSDSIASVVGYIGGAMYGLNDQILKLYYQEMLKHDDYEVLVKAYKLYKKQNIKDAPVYQS